jgi:hypothetical protein
LTVGAVELRTEISIAAPPAVVWKVLTDFGGYRYWNPMVFSAEGAATEGSAATLRFRSHLGVPLRFAVRITRADADRELRWIGSRLGVSGEHYFLLERAGGGTHLVHGEVFRGLLAGPAAPLFRAQLPMFESFNRALADVAERRARAAGLAPTGDRAPAPR